jgi:hypothetical protein
MMLSRCASPTVRRRHDAVSGSQAGPSRHGGHVRQLHVGGEGNFPKRQSPFHGWWGLGTKFGWRHGSDRCGLGELDVAWGRCSPAGSYHTSTLHLDVFLLLQHSALALLTTGFFSFRAHDHSFQQPIGPYPSHNVRNVSVEVRLIVRAPRLTLVLVVHQRCS